jgi:hypothetical protein
VAQPGIRAPHGSVLQEKEKFFKILTFFRDGKNSDPGWKKIGSRILPGSATLRSRMLQGTDIKCGMLNKNFGIFRCLSKRSGECVGSGFRYSKNLDPDPKYTGWYCGAKKIW